MSENATHGGDTTRFAIGVVSRVGVPMAAAMWVLAEYAGGAVVSEMSVAALALAFVLVFVAFNQAVKIADDRLNDLGDDVIA